MELVPISCVITYYPLQQFSYFSLQFKTATPLKTSFKLIENWVCRKCRFCEICGLQKDVLSCNKCSRTFHALCVGGANYSKKKSKNGIWLCTACVKCKNCGATTPGPLPGSKWTHDFSLCAQCGKLMDQGSCCPLCHKWLVKLPSFTLFAVSKQDQRQPLQSTHCVSRLKEKRQAEGAYSSNCGIF